MLTLHAWEPWLPPPAPMIPAFRRRRQGHQKFKVFLHVEFEGSLSYTGPYLRMSLQGRSYDCYGFLVRGEETDGEFYSSRGLLTKHWADEAARVPGLCSAMDLLGGKSLVFSGFIFCQSN